MRSTTTVVAISHGGHEWDFLITRIEASRILVEVTTNLRKYENAEDAGII